MFHRPTFSSLRGLNRHIAYRDVLDQPLDLPKPSIPAWPIDETPARSPRFVRTGRIIVNRRLGALLASIAVVLVVLLYVIALLG